MKVVHLYSGGLDSTIVIEILKSWGAKVYPLHVTHKFLSIKHLPEIPGLKILDATKEFIEVVKSPPHGYGKNFNPCIDCRIMMLKKAREYMAELKADFVTTGEVLDQRPMSQRLDTMMRIEREAGLEGLVVRPLSGRLLPTTIPEQKGVIDRDKLLIVKGRSRKFALDFAAKHDLKDYFSPSGGCLLTDPGFSRRLADAMRYQDDLMEDAVERLKIGRHFRIAPDGKLIVGRNEEENLKLEELAGPFFFLFVPDIGSPNTILEGAKKHLKLAAAVTARYSDRHQEKNVEVHYRQKKKTGKIVVDPIPDDELARWRI
jgi:tRNA U34 2-thiouridine synthase MnmA/TrmU